MRWISINSYIQLYLYLLPLLCPDLPSVSILSNFCKDFAFKSRSIGQPMSSYYSVRESHYCVKLCKVLSCRPTHELIRGRHECSGRCCELSCSCIIFQGAPSYDHMKCLYASIREGGRQRHAVAMVLTVALHPCHFTSPEEVRDITTNLVC